MLEVIEYLGRTQQRVRRNASPVQTDAAEIFTLDDCCLETELSCPDGGNVAPWTRTDDDHVKARFSHSADSASTSPQILTWKLISHPFAVFTQSSFISVKMVSAGSNSPSSCAGAVL